MEGYNIHVPLIKKPHLRCEAKINENYMFIVIAKLQSGKRNAVETPLNLKCTDYKIDSKN